MRSEGAWRGDTAESSAHQGHHTGASFEFITILINNKHILWVFIKQMHWFNWKKWVNQIKVKYV